MTPDLGVTRIGRYTLPEPVPVTLLPPPQPGIFTRIWRWIWIFGGPAVANPTATATFDKSVYNPGDLMTITVKATGSNVSAQPFTVPVTVTDEKNPSASVTVQAATTINQPDPLQASEGDASGRTWTPGTPSQTGQNFTQTFSSTA